MGITIAGINHDEHLQRATFAITNVQNAAPDNCSFNLKPGSPKPAVGSEVLYTDPDGNRLFGGVLTSAVELPRGEGYACSCSDWRARIDRKTLNDRFVNATAGQIIKELFNKYLPGEFDLSQVSEDGREIASIRFKRGTYITGALTKLAELTGYIWDIDPNKNVIWDQPGTLAAPFGLSDGSYNFADLTIEPNRDQLRNKVIVKGGLTPSTVATVDRFTGDGLSLSFRLSKVPYGTDQYLVFDEGWSGGIDPTKWVQTDTTNPTPPAGHIPSDGYIFTTVQQGAQLQESGFLQVVGGSSVWGESRIQSYLPYSRGNGGRRFEFDVYPNSIGTAITVGLFDPANPSSTAGIVYGFRFATDNTIKPNEAGTNLTALATVTYAVGEQIRLRIIPKATSGAVYWVNKDAANGFRPSQWVKLYDSAYSSLANLTVTPAFNFNASCRVDRVRVYNRLYNMTLTVGGVEKVLGLLNIDEDSGADALIGTVSNVPVLSFFGDVVPASAAAIAVTYYDGIPVVIQAQDDVSIQAIKALEGNDGIYEGYIEDPSLDSRELARARGQQELEQFSNPVTTLTFRTTHAGLRANQLLFVTLTDALSKREVNGSFLINSVTITSKGSGNYEYTVTAGSKLKGIEDYIYEMLIKGKQEDPTEDDNSPIDELIWSKDEIGFTSNGSVSGPAVVNADSFFFEDLSIIAEGPLGPYKYGGDGNVRLLPTSYQYVAVSGDPVTGVNILKTAGAQSTWDAGAFFGSTKIAADQNCIVEFQAGETTTYKMCALNSSQESFSYADLDYALYPALNGIITIYENGVGKGNFGTYIASDIFSIVKEDGVIRYKKNGVTFYTSATIPVTDLYLDTAFYTLNASLKNITLKITNLVPAKYGQSTRM